MHIRNVWVTPHSGSLIINAGVEPNQTDMRWPNTEEIIGAIAQARAGHTTAERSQRDILPQRASVWPGAACADARMDDSVLANNPQGLGFRLVTEKSLNPKTLFGEQDPKNKISYNKWSRQINYFIESKGVDGMELSKAMDWAVGQGRGQTLEDHTVFATYPSYEGSNTLKQLKLLIQNWTDGMAEQTIAYNVHNGLDA